MKILLKIVREREREREIFCFKTSLQYKAKRKIRMILTSKMCMNLKIYSTHIRIMILEIFLIKIVLIVY